MTIAFNGLMLSGQWSGIGTYAYNLMKTLWDIDQTNNYIGWIPEASPFCDLSRQANVTLHRTPVSTQHMVRHFLWEQTQLPFALRQTQTDMFFSPSYTLPVLRISRSAYVVTVHDLILHHCPKTKKRLFNLYMQMSMRQIVRSSDLIIVDSDQTRRDLIDIYHIAEDRLVTIHLAASDFFAQPVPDDTLHNVQTRYDLGDTAILAVGDIEPRKNVTTLIKAVSMLKERGMKDLQLVLVGKHRRGMDTLYKQIADHNLKKETILTGYISQEDLSALYRLARVFVYPSLYEGFGIPPLEAMLAGTPVVASNTSSVPEAVGKAGILVDPANPKQMADGIEEILVDDATARKLTQLGYQQARQFSWEKTARRTLQVFQSTVSN